MHVRHNMLSALLLAALLAMPVAVAADDGIRGLYEAELRVPDQSLGERQAALRAGLGHVMTRITGRQYVVHPGLGDALADAERYVQQFRYSSEEGRITLWARYDEGAINRLLEEHGLPVWGRVRPRTLAWIAVDDGVEGLLLDSQSDHRVRELVDGRARLRGMPLRWPLMDLDDSRRIRLSDVRAGHEPVIEAASRRYAPEAILVGRVERDPEWGGWQAHWRLLGVGEPRRWTTFGALLAEALDAGVDQTFASLAAAYVGAGEGADEGLVELAVSGITRLEDYVRVRDYLEGLSDVRHVTVSRVESGRAVFAISPRGDRGNVARTIALGGTLLPDGTGSSVEGAAGLPMGEGPVRLDYRFLP